MPRTKPMLLLTALSGVLVGCKDSPTEPAEPLNEDEAKALYLGLFSVATDTMPEIVSQTGDSGVLAFVCPRGGEMEVEVDFDEEGPNGAVGVTVIMVMDPTECVIWSEGYQFTLDGTPNVRVEMTLSSMGQSGSFDLDMTATGALDWQLDDRSGNCVFDFSVSAGLDLSNIQEEQAETTGTICGLEVELDPVVPPV